MSPELDITLLLPHLNQLRSLLSKGVGVEAAGYMLLGVSDIAKDPWSQLPRRRFISHKFLEIEASANISASATHVTWQTDGFMRLLCDAKDGGYIPAIVHTHPKGHAIFSEQDDKNESELARVAHIKGMDGLISILIDGQNNIAGRLWLDENTVVPIKRIYHVGRTLALKTEDEFRPSDNGILDRQKRLFGTHFNSTMQSLRVGIVGGGATGSAVIQLLMRLGIGKLIMLDKDIIEVTNLNRVHGSRRGDVLNKLFKTDLHLRSITDADLGSNFVSMKNWAGEDGTGDALKSCDVIFGCTDDHAGRIFINRIARFYGIPVIDVGLRMQRRLDDEFDVFGRVSTLVPGHPCLICGGVINAQRAREETLQRNDPDSFNQLIDEAYVVGEGDPSPAVVSFTTEMACVAVNELIAGFTKFHEGGGMHAVRTRRFHASDDRFPKIDPSLGCLNCSATHTLGRGDIVPFLDIVN